MPTATKTRDTTKMVLFGLSAGYCQYRGCDKRNLGDPVTGEVFNTGWVAHIIASEPGGPRGDEELSPEYRDDINNLMLLCDVHHRLVDKQKPKEHPAPLLREMKAEHEARVASACGIPPDSKSHVLLFGANIGEHKSVLDYRTAAPAVVAKRRYPAGELVIQTKDDSRTERTPTYWAQELANLDSKFEARVRPVLAVGDDPHVSVFALAPQPLLVRLGTLLSDKVRVGIYQRHREPVQGWEWPDLDESYEPLAPSVDSPTDTSKRPALVISLSATVAEERVKAAMGNDCAIWHVGIPKPNHHCIRSPEDLATWRKFVQGLLNDIKSVHGHRIPLHIFPVMPNSAAVALGLVRQEKADMPFHLYDALGDDDFTHAFNIE